MRNLFVLISLVLTLLLLSSSAKDSTAKQLKDFAIFKAVLLKKEGTIDLHNSMDSLNLFFRYAEAKLQKEQSKLNQFKLYSAALSMIRCGHTQIHPNKAVLFEWLTVRNALPFDYYFIGKNLVVNELVPEDIDLINEGKSDYEKKKHIPAGAEIITIDLKTIPELMQDISPYLSSDEDGIDFKYFQAGQMFEFYRHISSPFSKDSIHVKYVFNEDTSEIYFVPGAAPVRTINLRSQKNAERFKKEESEYGRFTTVKNVGYFRFNSFKASYGKKYFEFLNQSFEKLERKEINRLIIDLRGNTGGAMQYELMSYFLEEGTNLGTYSIQKPKKGIENKHLKKFSTSYTKHRKASRAQQRLVKKGNFERGKVSVEKGISKFRYKGQIIVITDEGSFSSASILACHLKTLCNAKIIGRTAGGSFYSGNAGTLNFSLPHSEFRVFVNPNTYYSHLSPSNNAQEIKHPDIFLDPLILDKKQLDDFYLNQAIASFD